MIAEALKFLTDLSTRATAPVKLEIPDPRTAYYAFNGEGIEIPIPDPPREHAPRQLEDIIRLAERFADEGDHSPAVWYDEGEVWLVIDDQAHRCETASLTLIESDVFKTVRSLAGGTKAPSFDHKSFVRLLRIDLAGALPPAALLDVVRRVKFDNGTVATSQVVRSRESIGREITSTVSAESEIPDTVTLSVPVYKTRGETDCYPLRCTVEVDPMEGRFRLIPFPDEIERVQGLAVASIADRLAVGLPASVPAYYGTP